MPGFTPNPVQLVREAIAQGETAVLTVSSPSMTPLLPVGSQIKVRGILASLLHKGDIITLATETELWTHRFWGWQDGKLQTRGDRGLKFDPLWGPVQLVGKVILPSLQETLSQQIFSWLQWEVAMRKRAPILVRGFTKMGVYGVTAVYNLKQMSARKPIER